MVRTGKILLLSFLALALAATKVRAATYAVTITSTQFIPATLQVSVGDQISFLNSDIATQSARTTDPDGFNTGDIGPGQTKSVTLSTAGTFTYSSAYNSALTGTVTVLAGTGSISTTSGTTTTVTTTQPQPVSGTFEIVLALTAGGFAFLGFGWHARRQGNVVHQSVVNLPLVSSSSSAEGSNDARVRQ